jgi:hypothetical protein
MNWMSRCSLELIGRAGVGAKFDNLHEDSKPGPYATTMKQLMYAAFLVTLSSRTLNR